jgi:activating signal cointegrator 1
MSCESTPSSEIRSLTLHQPWASLMALGLKRYETRSWQTPYRGKIAIHAAKRLLDDAALETTWKAEKLTDQKLNPCDFKYPLGCIVAIANVTDCLPMSSRSPEPGQIHHFENGSFATARWQVLIHAMSPLERAMGDWQVGHYAWKLENVVALPTPIPFKGAQGLRRIRDATVLERIHVQLEAGE